ncbi:MAG: carboxypeptidase regulatory-like domain-containing protein [Armatimonadota bacterium]
MFARHTRTAVSALFAVCCALGTLLALSAPSSAVTWVKVDGQTAPATFSIHDDIVVTLDCAAEGNTVRLRFALDLNKDGKYQEGEPVDTSENLVDQETDMDPTPRVIAVPFHVNPSTPPGQYVAYFEDDDGSVLGLTAFVLPKSYPQSIEGTALGEDGKPVPFTLVWVRNPQDNDEVASNWADENGRFVVEVPEGTFKVHTESLQAVESTPKMVTVNARERVTGIRLLVRSGILISGTVLDSTDKPVPYALVRAEGKDGVRETQSFVDGTYSFAVPAGTYTVSIPMFPDPYATEVTVEDVQVRNVNLYAGDYGRVEGTIVLAHGGFDPNTTVQVTDSRGRAYAIPADGQGGAYAVSLPPGKYTLTAVLKDTKPSPESRDITVEAGKTLSALDFSLSPTAVPGDVSGDGRVSVPDATMALQIAVGKVSPTPQQLAAGDLNGNGKIDIADVTRILRKAVGME